MERAFACFSECESGEDAFNELVASIKLKGEGNDPILIIFSSSDKKFDWFSGKIKEKFLSSTVIGTSSYINITSEGFGHNGVSALCIMSGIEVSAGIIEDIVYNPMASTPLVKEAVDSLSGVDNTLCLEFTTAFYNSEEIVLDSLKFALKDLHIPVFGGSAGALLPESKNYVSIDGKTYDKGCVFALIRNTEGKIGLFKENIYKPMNRVFTATDVDCEERVVYEFDGMPAAEAFAKALDVGVDKLPDIILSHPLGRIIGDDICITEGKEVREDGSISFYARIYNCTKLAILESDNLEKVWSHTAQEVNSATESKAFSIVINCAARSALFEKEDKMSDFVECLTKEYGPLIGISGFGEQLNSEHFNQTMLLAVFE